MFKTVIVNLDSSQVPKDRLLDKKKKVRLEDDVEQEDDHIKEKEIIVKFPLGATIIFSDKYY